MNITAGNFRCTIQAQEHGIYQIHNILKYTGKYEILYKGGGLQKRLE